MINVNYLFFQYPEFSEAELNDLFKLFCKNATPPNKTGGIDLEHMKQMLQSLDLAQTHLEAKTTFEKYTNGTSLLKLDHFMKMVIDLTAKNGKISLDVSNVGLFLLIFINIWTQKNMFNVYLYFITKIY